jgi:hypothetical protein
VDNGRLDLISEHGMHVLKQHTELHKYVQLIHVHKNLNHIKKNDLSS